MMRIFLIASFVLVVPFTAAGADDLGPDLKRLLSARQGGGNDAEVAKAWRRVARCDAGELPRLLAALNDASPLAANWVRSAVDAIAQRTLKQGGELPGKALEQFVLNKSHTPRARRLAYELLAKADKTAEDRLIPRLLNDPSVEFRRHAVSRLLKEAGKLPASGRQRRLELFLKALSGARDKDQVATIVKELDELGRKIDLPAHYGFILRWKLIGPFDNEGKKGFDVAYPPEKRIEFSARYAGKKESVKWIGHASEDTYGMVDLNKALGKHMGAAGYGTTEFHAAAPRTVQFRLNSLCAVKLWLNGKLIINKEVYHAGSTSAIDRYVGEGQLKKGRNVILVKCCQNEQTETWAQNWDFQLRVCDAAGTAVLSTERGQ